MSSGYFPGYATTPEAVDGSADQLERTALRMGEVQGAVHAAKQPVRAAVEGEIATVIAEAPNRLDDWIRRTSGASLVAVGALRLFGQAVRDHDGTMDDLERQWQAAPVDDFGVAAVSVYAPANDAQATHLDRVRADHAAEVASARDAKLGELLGWKRLAEAVLDDRAGDAAAFLARPTAAALRELFAAGHLPSRVPRMFPGIAFVHRALPSEVRRMSDSERAAYALEHPGQAALLTPILSAEARRLVATRIEDMAAASYQSPYVGRRLDDLAEAFGFAGVSALLLVWSGDVQSLAPGELAARLRSQPWLIEDEQVRPAVRVRIDQLGSDAGAADGAMLRAAVHGDLGPDEVEAALGGLSLVSLYGEWAQRSGETLPDGGAGYLRGLYDDVEHNDGDEPMTLEVARWLAGEAHELETSHQTSEVVVGQSTGRTVTVTTTHHFAPEEWMRAAYLNGLLLVSDNALTPTETAVDDPAYLGHGALPLSILRDLNGDVEELVLDHSTAQPGLLTAVKMGRMAESVASFQERAELTGDEDLVRFLYDTPDVDARVLDWIADNRPGVLHRLDAEWRLDRAGGSETMGACLDSEGYLVGPDGHTYYVLVPDEDTPNPVQARGDSAMVPDTSDGGWTTLETRTGTYAVGSPADDPLGTLARIAAGEANFERQREWRSIGEDQDEYLATYDDGSADLNGDPTPEPGRYPDGLEGGGEVTYPMDSNAAKVSAGVVGMAVDAMKGFSDAKLAEYDRHVAYQVVFQENDTGFRRAVVVVRQAQSNGEEIRIAGGYGGFDQDGSLVPAG